MTTDVAATVFALVLTSAIFALAPWGIAQRVPRYHPGLQDKNRRSTYRWTTFAAATALSMAIPVTGALSYMAAVGLALYLHFHWRHVARTSKGRAALEYQREEQKRERANERAELR